MAACGASAAADGVRRSVSCAPPVTLECHPNAEPVLVKLLWLSRLNKEKPRPVTKPGFSVLAEQAGFEPAVGY